MDLGVSVLPCSGRLNVSFRFVVTAGVQARGFICAVFPCPGLCSWCSAAGELGLPSVSVLGGPGSPASQPGCGTGALEAGGRPESRGRGGPPVPCASHRRVGRALEAGAPCLRRRSRRVTAESLTSASHPVSRALSPCGLQAACADPGQPSEGGDEGEEPGPAGAESRLL